MREWTPAQKSAINAQNSNILVSAAAGSGKTAVLVERVVRSITSDVNPVPLDKLLVVTFTNAAAAEMKSRISKALSDIIKKQPNNTNAVRQLSLIPSAQICTIDSFCMNLVRENFFKLDISQDFNILDNSQQLLLEQSAVEEIVEELYKENSPEFKSLVELLSTTKNDDELISAIKRINTFISSQAYPLEWLSSVGELYNPKYDIDSSPLKAYAVSEAEYLLSYIRDVIIYAGTLLDEYDEMYEKYNSMLEGDLNTVNSLLSSLDKSWDEIRSCVFNSAFASTPRAKNGFNPEYKEKLLSLRKIYNGADGILKKKILPLFSASAEDIRKDNEYLYPVFKSLIDIVKEFNTKLLEKKKELNSYSFSDIEHFAIQLLFYYDENGNAVRTDLAKELEGSYYEILVDEYQDTNAAQDMLFEMLSNGKNRFMVGDVKQSIYRFRLAMPSIFNDKKNTFEPYSEESKSINQKIILDKNFRSRKGICDFTNFVFSSLMSKRVGELDYTAEEYLNTGADYRPSTVPCAQLNIIDTPEGEDTDEYEARQAASEILRKINAKELIKDGDTEREIRFSDFAVLLRSAKKAMPVFIKVFSQFGIPTVSNNRVNLFENNEVAILLSFLRVVDNPVRDIPLLATLMSVFYGYSPDDIARARVNFKADNLYSSICRDSAFERFTFDLEKYRRYASSMSVEGFIRQLLSETSYMSMIAAMGNFEQRRLNIMKFIDIARLFDSGESVGLTAFIRYIDRIIEAKLDVESAEITGFSEDAVQIMSVHKSKGLEFPVVILAGSAHRYNFDDNRDSVLLNHTLGIGLKVNNEEELYRYESLQFSLMKSINLKASMSENLRVLYVAITRAKEQFIAYASYKKANERIVQIGEKLINGRIPEFTVENTRCDADLLLMCAQLYKSSEADFDFDIKLISSDVSVTEDAENTAAPDERLIEDIRNKLSFKYERLGLSGFSSKRTASSLDSKEQSFKYFAKSKPAFLSGDTLTGAQKGTAMHLFMQYCDYENAKTDLDSEIERIKDAGFITELQAKSLNRKKLSNLFNSAFAKRMFESDGIYREIKVSSFVPVNELEDTQYTDKVLVQGIADCVFEENGELVLVDYKTDYVQCEEELLSLYRKQIAFYKYAVSKTLGKNVKEAMLYSFCLDKTCSY